MAGDPDGKTTLRLEGRLVGPWVDELARVCATFDGGRVRLDLAGLSFADDRGLALLRKFRDRNAALSGCSGFLEELLGRPRRE